MIENILSIDSELFLFFNAQHTPWLDSIMLALSYNYILMGIFLACMLTLSVKKYGRKMFPLFFILILAFGLSDSISTKVFKNNTKRLRPCHQPKVQAKAHLAGKKCGGGKYGFVSSHAANSFAISTFFFLILRSSYSYIWLIYIYSTLVAYSRIYLARHYPLDIFCGALLGIFISLALFWFVRKKFRTTFFGTSDNLI